MPERGDSGTNLKASEIRTNQPRGQASCLSLLISQNQEGAQTFTEKRKPYNLQERKKVNQTIVMPIGIIEETAPNGATFRLTPQGQNAGLRTDTQVTVWRYHPEQLAMAKYAGRITQISGETATFSILRVEVDDRWPLEINPMEPGAPVYLAQRGSFEPDITLTTAKVNLDGPGSDQ